MEVQDTGGLKIDKRQYSAEAFKGSKDRVTVQIPLEGAPESGTYQPRFRLSFSVCSDDECLVLRNEVLSPRVEIK